MLGLIWAGHKVFAIQNSSDKIFTEKEEDEEEDKVKSKFFDAHMCVCVCWEGRVRIIISYTNAKLMRWKSLEQSYSLNYLNWPRAHGHVQQPAEPPNEQD